MQNDRVVLLSSNPGIDGANVTPTRLVLLRTAIARKVDVGRPSTPGDETPSPTMTTEADGTGRAEDKLRE